MKYYLSHQGVQNGPWSVQEILAKIEAQEITWSDYLFDGPSKEWVLLMEHPHFAVDFKKWMDPKKPLEPIKADIIELPLKNEKEWFVLKGENKYGPFNFVELLKMLQEKSIYEYDFVWNTVLPQWRRIAEIEDFQSDKIKNLQQSEFKVVKDAFYRRRYSRAAYNTSLLVHNSRSVWKGHGLEISSGGAGIIIDSGELEPGQSLFLHFKAGDGVPPFNAICSIVSKQFVNGPDKPVRYGVKFTSISQSVQLAIKAFADRNNNQKAAS